MNSSFSEEVCLTKQQVAISQLETAIQLFFEQKDFVSVLTLSEASIDIMRSVAKAKGLDLSLSGSFRDSYVIRPEKRKWVLSHLNRHRNFFKHAAKDYDETIIFKPSISIASLVQSAFLSETLGWKTKKIHFFLIWFMVKNPDLLKESEFSSQINMLATVYSLNSDDFSSWSWALNNLHTIHFHPSIK